MNGYMKTCRGLLIVEVYQNGDAAKRMVFGCTFDLKRLELSGGVGAVEDLHLDAYTSNYTIVDDSLFDDLKAQLDERDNRLEESTRPALLGGETKALGTGEPDVEILDDDDDDDDDGWDGCNNGAWDGYGAEEEPD